MLCGQRQAPICDFARGDILRPREMSEVDTPEDRHVFRRGATIAQQVAGAGENSQGFRRGIALGCRHRWPEGQVKIEFFAEPLARWGLRLRQLDPLSKMLDVFSVRRPAEGEVSNFVPQ